MVEVRARVAPSKGRNRGEGRRSQRRVASRQGQALRFAAGLLLAHLAVGASALAQPGSAPTAPTRAPANPAIQIASIKSVEDIDEKVKEPYKNGVTALRAQQWNVAQQLLLKVFNQPTKDRWIAAQLGYAEYKGEKYRDAAEHLSFFLLSELPESLYTSKKIESSVMETLKQALEGAKKKIGTPTIIVQSKGTKIDGAKVLIDEVEVGDLPLTKPVYVNPGTRVFTVRSDGYEPLTRQIQVNAGDDSSVLFELTPIQPPERGSKPGTNPGTGLPQIPMIVEPTPPTWRTPAMALGTGLAIVGGGLGIGFSIAAANKNSDAIEERDALIKRVVRGEGICPAGDAEPRCKKFADLARARDAYQSVAITGFVVGGVAAVSAVVAALWGPREPAPGGHTSTSLMILPYPQGAIMMGSF